MLVGFEALVLINEKKSTSDKAATTLLPLFSPCLWAGIGLMDASRALFITHSEVIPHASSELFLLRMLFWLPWAAATPLISGCIATLRSRRVSGAKKTLAHLGFGGILALVSACWVAWLESLLNPFAVSTPVPFRELWRIRLMDNMAQYALLYLLIMGASLIIQFRERDLHDEVEKARLEERLVRAQLDALRWQIEPHFLLNTLNSISSQIRDCKNSEAIQMIAALSNVLRLAMRELASREFRPDAKRPISDAKHDMSTPRLER